MTKHRAVKRTSQPPYLPTDCERPGTSHDETIAAVERKRYDCSTTDFTPGPLPDIATLVQPPPGAALGGRLFAGVALQMGSYLQDDL